MIVEIFVKGLTFVMSSIYLYLCHITSFQVGDAPGSKQNYFCGYKFAALFYCTG